MRLTLIALLAVSIVGIGVPAFAELQNVEVGGSIRIRGNWYSSGSANLTAFQPGNPAFNDDAPDLSFVEQRTTINVKADFTDDVTAFIELDSYNLFGDNFRGGGLGAGQVDGTAVGGGTSEPVVLLGVDNENETEVGFYQGYIEMREAWGYPLTFRMGRQEILLGSEWLVGNNDTASFFRGLSFDALTMRYDHDQFSITAFWARLAQNNAGLGVLEKEAQTDLYTLYFSYTGFEDMTIDAYWIYARVDSGAGTGLGEAMDFHTIGARWAGTYSQFDWDIEGAVQFGDSGVIGVDQDAFGITGELGYTFDVKTQPRLFVLGDYYSGDDDDAAFNRLFSDHELSEFLGNTDLSNIWRVGGGISLQATEQLSFTFVGSYYAVDEDTQLVFLGLPIDTAENLGVEAAIYATYNYSEDLYFEAGFAHFFTDSDLGAGTAFVAANGTVMIGSLGAQDDDLNYVYIETGISF